MPATPEYAYQYDDIGNRITSTDITTNRTYTANNLNQYTLVGRADPSAPQGEVEEFVPQYDDDGNQTLIQTSTGVWSVQYNGENRPVLWTGGTQSAATNIVMSFDRMGRRVEYLETAGGAQASATETNAYHRFLYDNYLCIQRLDAANGNAVDLAFVWDVAEPIATRPLVLLTEDVLSYYTHDGNNNVAQLISSFNEVVIHYEYSPFGDITASTSDFDSINGHCGSNPFRFSSEYSDNYLALVCYNFRHYNPVNGRWLTRDPLGESGGINLNSFLANAVLQKIECFGLSAGSSVTGAIFYYGDNNLHTDNLITTSRCPCGKDLVYISDSQAKDNGFEAEARRTLKGSDGKYHSFRGHGTFDPNSQLESGECVCSLLVVMHGMASNDYADAGPYDVSYYENKDYQDGSRHDISEMFEGVRFCGNCMIELRACHLGRADFLIRRIADLTQCEVKAYTTTVHAGGLNIYDYAAGLTFNPIVVVSPSRR